ncbi:hypothetical protein ACJ41O_001401 [Fusarium nematophilum]
MAALTAIVITLNILRIYARVVVVKSYGVDDHVYLLATFFLLFFTVFIGVAAHYGFGQNMWDIPSQRHVMLAVLYECIAQTFNVIGMAVAKWSLGLFLLRIVQYTWHKMAIWLMMVELIAAAFGAKRATEIPKLLTDNYLKDSAGLIVWSAAEMAVTMICIGIPVCRPLYKNYIDRLASGGTSTRYRDLSGGAKASAGVNLRTFGGNETSVNSGTHEVSIGSSHRKVVTGVMTPKGFPRDNESEEGILGQWQPQDRTSQSRGIKVTTEYKVTKVTMV